MNWIKKMFHREPIYVKQEVIPPGLARVPEGHMVALRDLTITVKQRQGLRDAHQLLDAILADQTARDDIKMIARALKANLS